MQRLREKLGEYGKPNMPILYGEAQWTSQITANGWDYDQGFVDQWTYAFMSTVKSEGFYGACFWIFLGYDNNLAIIRPPSQDYERKPQFYSIKSFIDGTADQVATPIFTPSADTYRSNQSVTLSSSTSDSKIHYTLDGSNPTVLSTIYGTPISVSSNMTIKAKALKNGMIDSNVTTATYIVVITAQPTPTPPPSPTPTETSTPLTPTPPPPTPTPSSTSNPGTEPPASPTQTNSPSPTPSTNPTESKQNPSATISTLPTAEPTNDPPSVPELSGISLLIVMTIIAALTICFLAKKEIPARFSNCGKYCHLTGQKNFSNLSLFVW